MSVDRRKLYEDPEDFFSLDGNAIMKLSRRAAAEVCSDAAAKGLIVVKVEGGIWRGGEFEARLDAIWNGLDPPIDQEAGHQNNLRAARFVRSADPTYNAFILTSSSTAGYSHRAGARQVLINKA